MQNLRLLPKPAVPLVTFVLPVKRCLFWSLNVVEIVCVSSLTAVLSVGLICFLAKKNVSRL
jgi:hypothetical protein